MDLQTMQWISQQHGYTHTFAIRAYERNGTQWLSINPVCKDSYLFAVQMQKRVLANDNNR